MTTAESPSYERLSPLRQTPVLMAIVIGSVFLALIGGALFAYWRAVPLPEVAPPALPSVVPGDDLNARLPWPPAGSAAVSVAGMGPVGSVNDTIGYPLASLTKVMTALVILEHHPLVSGAAGPELLVTFEDAKEFLTLAGEDQSVVPVQERDVLTQRQLLEGLLIPSGNNYANLLARWDAGSLDAFVQRMNARAAELGMTQTHYADASGISPQSVGTAADQLLLAEVAMRDPVLAEIVRMQETTLPHAGVMHTTNQLLGTIDGVIGLKTGETDEAGGAFIIVTEREVEGQRVQVLGVVLGQPNISEAFAASSRLASAVGEAVRPTVLLPAGTHLTELKAGWGPSSDVITTQELKILGWPGMPVAVTHEIRSLGSTVTAGSEVGAVVVADPPASVPLQATEDIGPPGTLWRIFH